MLIWKSVEERVLDHDILTAFFIAGGMFQIVASITDHIAIDASWGWMLLNGVSDLLLAAISPVTLRLPRRRATEQVAVGAWYVS